MSSSIVIRSIPVLVRMGVIALFSATALFGMSLMSSSSAPPDFAADCLADEPWVAVACHRGQIRAFSKPSADAPSIVVHRESPGASDQFALATFAETGAIWGLATDVDKGVVYAASFVTRGLPHGPGGPGAIYRIDLSTGAVEAFIDVPNVGPDRHRINSRDIGTQEEDKEVIEWVGRSGLGGLTLNDDKTELFVQNVSDRRIYRYSVPEGTLINDFAHGAVDEPWAEDARPFALGFDDGYLYHGLVDEEGDKDVLLGRVYRSASDGSGMESVAELNFDRYRDSLTSPPRRRKLDWGPWVDPEDDLPDPEEPEYPSPWLTDIEVLPGGDLVLGVRDRSWDVYLGFVDHLRMETGVVGGLDQIASKLIGFGDILLARRVGDGSYSIDTDHFDGTNAIRQPKSAYGSIDALGEDRLFVSAFGVESDNPRKLGKEGIFDYSIASGETAGHSALCQPASARPYRELLTGAGRAYAHSETPTTVPGLPPPVYTPTPDFKRVENEADIASIGDVELLCAPTSPTEAPPPTVTLTPVVVPPSDTPVPPPDPTDPPPPTPTVTPEPALALASDRAEGVLRARTDQSGRGIRDRCIDIDDRHQARCGQVRCQSVHRRDASYPMIGWGSRCLIGRRGWFIRSAETQSRSSRPSMPSRSRRGLGSIRVFRPDLKCLSDAREGDGFTSVLVVLTDGLQEAEPETAGAVAERVIEEGVVLHVVGLGADVDAPYLGALAGAAERLHLSPGTDDLEGIYTEIAKTIPCPAASFWGRR